MAKEPDQRYQSADELARAAADALDTDITTPVRPQTAPTAPWTTRAPQPPATRPAPATPAQPPRPAWQDAASYPSGHFSGPPSSGAGGGFPPAVPPGAPPPYTHPGSRTPARRRRRGRIAAVVAALVLVIAAATVTTVLLTGNNDHPYQPQTFTHVHGTTTVTSAPHAVAALGPGDGDAVLSLGMQPVAIGAPNGALPSWEQQAVTGSPKILGFPDTAAVAAAKPDVIIMTGDIDDPTYTKLAAIAPTAQDDLRTQHGSFQGKTVAAAGLSDSGITLSLTQSNVADYLQGLGFRYEPTLQPSPVNPGPTRPLANDYEIGDLKTDVLVVMRTDKAAKGGGYGGLPDPFRSYGGTMVIVDDPNILAALADPGGYLATQFLNSAFVKALAQEIT
jgi:hypothetical protein